ncbi:MAG: MerR family transcriptional regulator [Armatimonadetes bacterium]|nr:MerR family transcriptional regulator [Armatimonadota bacterium]
MDKDEPVYMIGVAAKLCDVHPQTLRLYERLGLIRPKRVSSKNRLYSQADIERLQQIQRFTQELGVNLAGVEIILNLLEKMERMHAEMEHEMERVRREMEEEMARRVREIRSQRR